MTNDKTGAKHEQATAVLGSVAQLLVRVSYYLGVRLPAEITLPGYDYPLPTIFSPTSSYQARDVPFPGTTPSHSSSTSPDASRFLEHQRPLPRPRPLFFDRPLPDLMKEDPHAYSWFVEGVSLLAYDVAWLCRTQGMHDDLVSFEEIAAMGRNLYRLLVDPAAERPAPAGGLVPTRGSSSSSAARNGNGGRTTTPIPPSPSPAAQARTTTPVQQQVSRGFGQLSHATAHHFLGAAAHADVLRNWEYQNPARIVDRLKATLLMQMQNAEWEVVEEREWDGMVVDGEMEMGMGMEEEEDEPVVVGVGGRRGKVAPSVQQEAVVRGDGKGKEVVGREWDAVGGGNGALGGLGSSKRRSMPGLGLLQQGGGAGGAVGGGGSSGAEGQSAPAAAMGTPPPPIKKGVNGWTRLKSRNGITTTTGGIETGAAAAAAAAKESRDGGPSES